MFRHTSILVLVPFLQLCVYNSMKRDDAKAVKMEDPNELGSSSSFSSIFMKVGTSPLNLALVGCISFLVYKIIKSRSSSPPVAVLETQKLPKLRRDFTVEELKKYDGTQPDGRILMAVNGKVFDVTARGKQYYGPGGPYAVFGGRDATRGLAKFCFDYVKEEYDDLSDLNAMEMESALEWEIQFKEKYDYVGRLLKPGEEPTNYSDEEEEDAEKVKSE